jgi:hypothetical protein
MAAQMPAATRFLRLRGRIGPGGTLQLRPGYLVSRRRVLSSRGPWHVIAEVRSRGGDLLSRTPVVVRSYCADGSKTGPSAALAIFVEVPIVDNAALIEILRLDPSGREPVRLATLRIADTAPRIEIVDAPCGQASGRQILRWSADGDPPPVQFRVRYSNDDGQRWQAMVRPTTERQVEVNLDEFPGGERCRIAVLATNGTRSQEAISEPFAVRVKPCQPMIQSPPPGARLATGDTVLIGNGWWLETMRPELDALVWTSDRQGELGRGRTVHVSLTPGHHRITLRAGSDARAGETTVEIDVDRQKA